MQIDEIMTLARQLINEHGLRDWQLWKVGVRKKYGSCSISEKLIVLSSFKLPKCKDEYAKNTILHEIAHALVRPGHAHDKVWENKFIEIGGFLVQSDKERLTVHSLAQLEVNKTLRIKRAQRKKEEFHKMLYGQKYQKL